MGRLRGDGDRKQHILFKPPNYYWGPSCGTESYPPFLFFSSFYPLLYSRPSFFPTFTTLHSSYFPKFCILTSLQLSFHTDLIPFLPPLTLHSLILTSPSLHLFVLLLTSHTYVNSHRQEYLHMWRSKLFVWTTPTATLTMLTSTEMKWIVTSSRYVHQSVNLNLILLHLVRTCTYGHLP